MAVVAINKENYVHMLTVSNDGHITFKKKERKRISVKSMIAERLSSNCNKYK